MGGYRWAQVQAHMGMHIQGRMCRHHHTHPSIHKCALMVKALLCTDVHAHQHIWHTQAWANTLPTPCAHVPTPPGR